MPIYEYSCPSCQKVHEVIQKFSDPALTQCPVCKNPVEKLISRTSFQLKGSGWYATDYKKSTQSPTPAPSSSSPMPPPPSSEKAAVTPPTPAKTESSGSNKKD